MSDTSPKKVPGEYYLYVPNGGTALVAIFSMDRIDPEKMKFSSIEGACTGSISQTMTKEEAREKYLQLRQQGWEPPTTEVLEARPHDFSHEHIANMWY